MSQKNVWETRNRFGLAQKINESKHSTQQDILKTQVSSDVSQMSSMPECKMALSSRLLLDFLMSGCFQPQQLLFIVPDQEPILPHSLEKGFKHIPSIQNYKANSKLKLALDISKVNQCEPWWIKVRIMVNQGVHGESRCTWWIMVNQGESRWIKVNQGESRWIKVNQSESRWIMVNEWIRWICESRWNDIIQSQDYNWHF